MKSRADLIAENNMLRLAISDIHWMARRYADGRATYAASDINKVTRQLMSAGIKFYIADGTPWARDAMGRQFDGLTDDEAAMGGRRSEAPNGGW